MTKNYIVDAHDCLETDVKVLTPLFERAVNAVIAEFRDLDAERILRRSSLVFEPVRRPGIVDPDSMVAATGPLESRISFVAPSARGAVQSDGFPATHDRVWHHRNLIHECTAAFMWTFSGLKANGWRLSNAPGWFNEGFQEYLAVERAAPEARARYRRRYWPRLSGDYVAPSFSSVMNDYADGYLILRFLHDAYGARRLHQLLASGEPTFWDACCVELGTDREALYRSWEHWCTEAQQKAP